MDNEQLLIGDEVLCDTKSERLQGNLLRVIRGISGDDLFDCVILCRHPIYKDMVGDGVLRQDYLLTSFMGVDILTDPTIMPGMVHIKVRDIIMTEIVYTKRAIIPLVEKEEALKKLALEAEEEQSELNDSNPTESSCDTPGEAL